MSKINEKLKVAVKESLAKQKAKKSESKENYESIGIPVNYKARKDVTVYKIWKHPRATLDHSKHPNARWVLVEDAPMFATLKEGEKYCAKCEKEDPKTMYSARQGWAYVDTIDSALMKKIKVRKWGA